MFLPDPNRRGEIQFLLAKALPYGARLGLIAGLLGAGLLLQLFVSLWAGAIFLLLASLLATVRGFSNIPKVPRGRREWRGAEREQLEQVLRIAKKAKQWDQSLLDVTCLPGVFVLVLIVLVIAGVAFFLVQAGKEWLARAWILDSAVLLLPHWLTGSRRVLTNDPLTIRVRHLLLVYDAWEKDLRAGERMLPQLEVVSGQEGELPLDAKLVLSMDHLGEDFLGLQIQVVLNRVQGADFPYLYCVLVARPALGMLDQLEQLDPCPAHNLLLEAKRDGEVEIVVVRRQTTKTSGYHTRPAMSRRVFSFALGLARELRAPVAG